MPWRNAVFLFVNVLPAEQAPYPNAFLDGGRRITWYATDYVSLVFPHGSRANSSALEIGGGSCFCVSLCHSCWASPRRRCLQIGSVFVVSIGHSLCAKGTHSRNGVLLGTPVRRTPRATRSCSACRQHL